MREVGWNKFLLGVVDGRCTVKVGILDFLLKKSGKSKNEINWLILLESFG